MEEKSGPISNDDKLLGALGYLWFVSVIIYVLKKDNPFIVFHARQGIVLSIGTLFWIIPGIGWIIATIAVVALIIGFTKAYNGERYEMPFINKLAEKIKF